MIMGILRRIQTRILLAFGRFPSTRYSGKPRSGKFSMDYIGTWEKDVALIITNRLRKDGFAVTPRGRGNMKRRLLGRLKQYDPSYSAQSDCLIEFATHLAIYIRNARISISNEILTGKGI